ncbi:MAG: hypothetical protein JXR40_05490 [Pontiellaceae bacterium]|nr:hypothetical protein [Pontiellaceae bacterium]
MKTGENGGREVRKTKMNRWFFLALGFLIINAAAVIVWLSDKEDPDVHAELITPKSGQVAADTRDELHWRFSADMVSSNQVGKAESTGPIIFSPEIKGDFKWISPREFSFRPTSPWKVCSPYSAVFTDELRSLDGRPLDGTRTTAFRSDPLTLVDIRQASLPGNGNIYVDVEFNAAVHLPELWKHLKVLDAEGEAVEIIEYGSYTSHKMLRIMLGAIDEGTIEVRISKGLVSPEGPLGLEKDVTKQVEITRYLRVVNTQTHSDSLQSGSIDVAFNAPVDPAQIKSFISIQPKMDFLVEASSAREGRQYVRLIGSFEPGKSYTLTFAKELASETDQSLEKTDTRTVYFPKHSARVEFTAVGTYLSTQGNLSIPFKAVNSGACTVKIRRVYSNNLVYMVRSNHWGLDKEICSFEIPIDGEINEVVENRLDLRERLEGKTGVFYININGEKGGSDSYNVVVSDLGLSLRKSDKDLLVWVNSIRTLEPIKEATVKIFSAENQLLFSSKTDEQGLLLLNPEESLTEGKPYVLVVEKDDDLTYMHLNNSQVSLGGGMGRRSYLDDAYEAFVFTDRGIYRPGETVHCKALVRGRDAVCPEAFPVALEVIRPDGKVEQTLSGLLNEFGSAEFDIALADYVATGRYRLQLKVPGANELLGSASVAVEEFVPPQLRVAIRQPSERANVQSGLNFTVSAQHLFGSPAKDLTARARITFSPAPFSPAEWKDYAFGDPRRTFSSMENALTNQLLNEVGETEFVANIPEGWRPAAALRAFITGSVQETGGRTVTEYAGRVVDVYPHYIGIQRPEDILETGSAHEFALAVVTPDGSTTTNVPTLNVLIKKLTWSTVMRKSGNQYTYHSERKETTMETLQCTVKDGRASLIFEPDFAGTYRLEVENAIDQTASSLEFSVREPGQRWSSRSLSAPDVVEMELDKTSYRVGDTARLAINSPFPGKALLSVESDEILWHQVLELTNNMVEVELPVEAAYQPNVYCSVSVVRAALPEEIWGTHRAAGRIALKVDQPERALSVALELPEKIRPATRLEVPVQVTDYEGNGCAAEIVLAAVDEGICMLTDFQTPDPYSYFFGPYRPVVTMHDLYAQLMPESPDLAAGTSVPGGGMLSAIGRRLNPIKARRFKPTALWSSSIVTDTNGQAVVVFDVPEFTGQLRLMAVAVDPSRFGSAEQSVLVKRPLVVQSSLPRFLAPKDQFVLPVRVYNESEADGEVLLTVECEGPLKGASLQQTVALEAGASTNLTFALTAGDIPGKAVCRLAATMGEERYSESIELAVRPAAPLTLLSGNGKLAAGTNAVIHVAGNWLGKTGKSTLWLSGLPSVHLGGSIEYLLDYPYGCLEQTTSKSFPLLYLAPLVKQLLPGRLGEQGTTDYVQSGIHRILSMQRSSGGFSLWSNGQTYDWGTTYATHFLVEASKAGYDVPSSRLNEALDYIERRIDQPKFSDYNMAYSCLVLALADRPQHGTVARLCDKWDTLAYDVRINLISAQLAAGQRRIAVELLDRLGFSAISPMPDETGGSLRSAVRGNAFLLSALLDIDPESAEIPTLVHRLEDTQQNGRWRHTQDNAVALMALGKYTQRLADQKKPISGRVRWNNGTQSFTFENRDQLQTALKELQGETVQIENRSECDLYFHWKSEGVPADGKVDEHDQRIKIRRTLLDQQGKPVDPMNLKQGELYVMHWSIPVDESTPNLVIEDPLPAGLEVENGALNTTQSVQWIGNQPYRISMQHVDIRDDRVIAFPNNLNGKENHYYYAVRAVTVGEFVWPAVSAACMYDPSIESVHGAGTIRVTE